MRKFAKIMAVLLALGWLAASCSAKENVVTKWGYTQTRNGKTVTVYMTFYNDGTMEMSMTDGGETEVLGVCPYTGDTRKDGTITIDDGHGTTAEIKGDQLFGEGMVLTKVK